MVISRWVENNGKDVSFVAIFVTKIPFSLSGQSLGYHTHYTIELTLVRRVDCLLVLSCGQGTSKPRGIAHFFCSAERNEGVYMRTTTKPLAMLTWSQSSIAETGVEPFVLLPPTFPKTQMMQTPVDTLAPPGTGRSRLSISSMIMARTITQPSSPAPRSPARVSSILRRSRSMGGLSTGGRDLGLKYKAKWRGGNLQLSYSNLRPEEVPKEGVRSRTP